MNFRFQNFDFGLICPSAGIGCQFERDSEIRNPQSKIKTI